jgi:carbon monoxide dehydrogenase subunit G
MKNSKDKSGNSELSFSGEHVVPLSREDLWDSLNDPEVLQICIRGCDRVEKVGENAFKALFRLKVGPISKTFSATLNVVDPNPPSGYTLRSDMAAGMAGSVSGKAEVSLVSESKDCTRLNYHAIVDASGWIGELGVRVLGSTAEKYMQKFFDSLVSAAESRNPSL